MGESAATPNAVSLSEILKELLVDFERGSLSKAEFELLEQIEQFLAVHELDGGYTVPNSLATSLRGEGSSCENDSLVCATCHSSAEIPDLRGGNRPGVPLALEEHPKAHESIDFYNSVSVQASIARSASDGDLLKTRFAKKSLAESLETGRGQRFQQRQ